MGVLSELNFVHSGEIQPNWKVSLGQILAIFGVCQFCVFADIKGRVVYFQLLTRCVKFRFVFFLPNENESSSTAVSIWRHEARTAVCAGSVRGQSGRALE